MSAVRSCLVLLSLTVACSTPGRDSRYDHKACDPGCKTPEQICFQGQCIKDPCPRGGMVYLHESWESDSDKAFCITGYEATQEGSKGTLDWSAGRLPETNLHGEEAYAACRSADALLCTRSQWATACRGAGTEDGGDNRPALEDCNVKGSGLAKAGSHERCEGGFTGIFDILGNAAEYLMDDYRGQMNVEGKSAYGVAGLIGGDYLSDKPSCDDTPVVPQVYQAKGAGLRCCVPCDPSGGNCKASPLWFQYPLRDPKQSYEIDDSTGTFDTIWGSAENEIWAVINGELARFDGQLWTLDSSLKLGTNETVTYVWGTSAKDVWVVADPQTLGCLLYHYDGTTWSKAQDLTAAKVELLDMHGTIDNARAVGQDDKGDGVVYQYDGKTWTRVTDATLPAKLMPLYGVWTSAGKVWAVGEGAGVLHHDQSQWSQQTFDDKGLYMRFLDVHGTSSGQVWIAGWGRPKSGGSQGPLIYSWDGTKWQPQLEPDSKSSGSGEISLTSIHVVSDKDVWASGTVAYHLGSMGWERQTDKVDGPLWVSPQGQIFVGLSRRF